MLFCCFDKLAAFQLIENILLERFPIDLCRPYAHWFHILAIFSEGNPATFLCLYF